jgi:cellulose synthase/poly-beta-1,6-N-acetylglucosamine synthase-like glycosyltransferase
LISIFSISLLIIIYTIIGYPIFLYIFARVKRRTNNEKKYSEPFLPSVTFIVAAFNEEKAIKSKLDNCLELDYPSDKFKIVIVSDCSSDDTDKIVKSYGGNGIQLWRMPQRSGKVSGHKDVLSRVHSDIVIFSDATTLYHPSAIRELVKNFADDRVGCVGGALQYASPSKSIPGLPEQRYWSYETFIRKLESQVESLPAVSGAIYALRPKLYADMPEYLADDLVNPLHVRMSGFLTIYEPNALCWDNTNSYLGDEFQKRKRIAAQNVSGLLYMYSLLNPFRFPAFSWILFSHKVLRLLLPFALLLLIISALFLLPVHVKFMAIFVVLLVISVLALCYDIIQRKRTKRSTIFHFILYSLVSNTAIVVGVVEALFGKKYATWQLNR